MNRQNWTEKRNDNTFPLSACMGVVIARTEELNKKMADFKSTIVLLVSSAASLSALLKLNMTIISLTKLAY